MSGVKRRMAAGILALGTTTSIGGAAGAAGAAEKVDDYKWRYENTLVRIDNPCTPRFDDITLLAEWHTQGKLWENNDGSWWYQGSNRGHNVRHGGRRDALRRQRPVPGADAGRGRCDLHGHRLPAPACQPGDAPNSSLRYNVLIRFAADGSFSTMEILKEALTAAARRLHLPGLVLRALAGRRFYAEPDTR